MNAFAPFLMPQSAGRNVTMHGEVKPKAVISIADLRFSWNSAKEPMLDIESLQIVQGEQLFIAGPSGSGKSTLLNLLAGVITPQRGRVQVLGQRLENLTGAERDQFRADHIGFIFQLFNLIPYLSVVENVILPCGFSRLRRDKALHKGGSLQAEALRLLQHLDLDDPQLLKRPVTELSVGQQQRVAAARALIGAPDLLIADEPTSSLDSDLRERFISLLFEECRRSGTTLIFVSHDTTLQPLFSRSLQLSQINRSERAAVLPLKGGV